MLTVEERFMIKDFYRAGVSISEIARRTGHDRKTVRQAISEPLLTPIERSPRKRPPHKLDPYRECELWYLPTYSRISHRLSQPSPS